MKPYDSAETLTDDEMIAGYLQRAAKRDDADYFRKCLSTAMRARAINQLAVETGIDRQDIYEMFSEDVKPTPVIIAKITAAFETHSTTKTVTQA
jgi:probable addiction module antidote protein